MELELENLRISDLQFDQLPELIHKHVLERGDRRTLATLRLVSKQLGKCVAAFAPHFGPIFTSDKDVLEFLSSLGKSSVPLRHLTLKRTSMKVIHRLLRSEGVGDQIWTLKLESGHLDIIWLSDNLSRLCPNLRRLLLSPSSGLLQYIGTPAKSFKFKKKGQKVPCSVQELHVSIDDNSERVEDLGGLLQYFISSSPKLRGLILHYPVLERKQCSAEWLQEILITTCKHYGIKLSVSPTRLVHLPEYLIKELGLERGGDLELDVMRERGLFERGSDLLKGRTISYCTGLRDDWDGKVDVSTSRGMITMESNGLKCHTADSYMFYTRGQRLSIREYMENVKNTRVDFPKYPVIHLGDPTRNCFVPIELCWIIFSSTIHI